MGKSKFAVNALLVSVFLGTLVFPTAQAAGAGETYTMRMANITSNDTQERLAKKFIELVKEKSDDKIKLKDGSTNVKKKKDHIVNRGGRSCARCLNDSPF